jgi:ribulose kinase
MLHYGTIHNKRVISSLYPGLACDIGLISLCLGKVASVIIDAHL